MQMQLKASRWGALTPALVLGLVHILSACEDNTYRPVQSTPLPQPAMGAPAPSKPAADDSDTEKPSGGKKPMPTPPPDDAPADDVDVPDTLKADGEACRRDDQCESKHCNNRICCESGECCTEVEDCSADEEGESVECIKPKECQGRRGPVACRANRCVVTNGANDDSACGEDIVADDCGLYADAACTGEASQEAPACADSCTEDAECDAAAHCEGGKCVKDRGNDEKCERDSECESDSCSRGICCADGDCCETVADCPSEYAHPAMCSDAENCQGTRGEARCNAGKCETDEIEDDSGCGWWTPSKLCGQTRRLTCMGGTSQMAPSCGDGTCFTDAQCDNNQHCGSERRCVDDVDNGESCDRDALCASNHCNNGLCCDSGVCCRMGDTCADSFECVNPRECQGERYVNECNVAEFQCQPVETTEDDSVCWGQLIDACGTFADMRCSAEREQDVSERECPRWCASSWQCDPGLECAGPYCRIPPPPPPDNGGGGN